MDITLLYDAEKYGADIAIDNNDLLTGDELQTAIIMSLFTDRRAAIDDPVMIGESKRGWWGDTYNTNRNDKIGSRLWVLKNSKMTPSTLVKAKDYALEATRWLIEDNIASSIDVITQFYDKQTIAIQITIQRPNGSQTFNYSYVWGSV